MVSRFTPSPLATTMATMSNSNYDVIIVGCGPAGVSAAIGLAQAEFSVLVLEGAPFPGAENWSGAIYFAENLAHPDLLGAKGVEDLPFERRIVRRGMLMSNGHSSFGLSYRNAETFANSYSVLRPTCDHYLAKIAESLGATILNETTATSLIRHRGRIVGVNTDRGPFYSDLVFLAEGDASHLVSQEGYERISNPQSPISNPHFLQGIREVIPMSPAEIERIYGVGAGEGAAFEILLRNPDTKRRGALNIGGFIYTNADSLSVGLVLPLDLLAHHFSGDHNRLMEWFKGLPEVQRLIGKEPSIGYGAKIIRGGGFKEIPTLVDHGLAIGGAASGIGTDFPYPNYTGPATFMGLQIARAAREIRRSRGEFTRELLEKFYVAPLHQSHYYKNVEYLRDWPAYVEKTTFFFGRQLDAVLGPLYALSRPELSTTQKIWHAAKMLREAVPVKRLGEIVSDVRALNQALKLTDLARASFQSLAFRSDRLNDSTIQPFNNSFSFHYSVEGSPVPFSSLPFPFRRFFTSPYTQRAMNRAADSLYRNDDIPLETKLRRGLELCFRGLCPLDLALVGAAKKLIALLMPIQWTCEKLDLLFSSNRVEKFLGSFYQRYLAKTRPMRNLEGATIRQPFEQKLAMDTYFSEKMSHIHVLRPDTFGERKNLVESPLWHICPAKVYEVHPDDVGQSQVTVNFDNCVKCESCWRASPKSDEGGRGGSDVDWSRTSRQRLIYRVNSPASKKLFAKLCANGATSRPPKNIAPWLPDNPSSSPSFHPSTSDGLRSEFQKLQWALESFRSTLASSPRALSHDDQVWLQRLAFNASSVSQDADRVVRSTLSSDGESFKTLWSELRQQLAQIQVNVHRKKFFWADSICAQILDHHLPVLFRLMPALPRQSEAEAGASELPFSPLLKKLLELEDSSTVSGSPEGAKDASPGRSPGLLQKNESSPVGATGSSAFRSTIRARLDAAFDKQSIKELEKGHPFTDQQIACLRDIAQSCSFSSSSSSSSNRQILLEELARKDPSLAFLISHHWIASELLGAKIEDGKWRSLAFHGNAPRKLFVLSALAQDYSVIEGDKIYCVPRSAVKTEPVQTLGLAAAKVAHLSDLTLQRFNASTVSTNWQAKLVADLTSIALGAGRYLLERALTHANSRVQFPGTFRDEDGRDSIAKFGAVKQMLSEMEADVYLLETLSTFSSSFSSSSSSSNPIPEGAKESISHATALLVGELIGTQPGSLAYNCGQVFGGTAYSEDDVISKFYRDSGVFAFMLGRDIEQLLAIASALAKNQFSLAPTPDELALFEDAARRGALRYPIESLIAQCKELCRTAPQRATIGLSASRWWGVKLVLLRTAARLERGEDSRKQVECCRLLADRAGFAASGDAAYKTTPDTNAVGRLTSGGEFIITRDSESLGREILANGYFDEPLKRPIPFSYGALCREDQTYDFGDYLLKPFGSLTARYLPEHLYLDRELSSYQQRVSAIFIKLWEQSIAGLPYARHVEKLHAVPDSEIQMLLREGFMRMFIPKELGGEGRHKAEYYILVANSMRYGEPGIALTIQAHQSIGVTPMILGLFQDIPRAKHELQEFLASDDLVKKLEREIAKMLVDLHTPAVLHIKDKFTKLGDFVRAEIGKRASIRGIASDFIESFLAAGRAGLKMDLKGFEDHLKKAHVILPKLRARAESELAELSRREEAHKQFLRYIASGAISCFALTEPSAGSDTASVGTRAHLRRVEVFTEKNGSRFFWLDEKQTQKRRLIDATKWDLKPPPPETDVGQIRKDGDREFYEFYELNGAKMWITNAHIAGAMAMYAKTEVGPTGFMLRAPVEGLTVGNDELKMGQRGSPTNELGLSGVRVPRENIIGIEGRGQVNALETLNAGRMGLSVSSMAMMQKIIEQTRAFVNEHKLEDVAWVHELLGQMTEELYAVESLAFELIGVFDHKGTRNARVESAIGKYYGAEALHRVIRAAFSIHGILGQTAQYEIEKHLRDARILNIYEGTNEVQRFLILRDLVETLLPKWKSSLSRQTDGGQASSSNVGKGKFSSEIASLESSKHRLFRVLDETVKLFGPQIWNNPNFQPTFFPLAEIAGLIKVCDSVLGRTLWLASNITGSREPSDKRHLQLAETCAQNVLAKSFAEIERLFHRVEHQLDPNEHYHEILRRGFYPPEIRIATLALREGDEKVVGRVTSRGEIGIEGVKNIFPTSPAASVTRPTKPIHIAVVLQPQPVLSPRPQLSDGKIIEPYWTLPPADCHALVLALKLKKQHSVHVTVVARGPAFVQNSLRQALAMGADEAVWVADDSTFSTPTRAAQLVVDVLCHDAAKEVSLVIAGDEVFTAALASRFELNYVFSVSDLSLACHSERSEESHPIARTAETLRSAQGDTLEEIVLRLQLAALPDCAVTKQLPIAVSVAVPKEINTVGFDSDGYLASFGKPVRRVEALAPTPAQEFALPEAPVAAEKVAIDSPEAAAKLFVVQAQIGGATANEVKPFEGVIETKSVEEIIAPANVYLVVVGQPNGVSEAAVQLAARSGLPLTALAFCERDEAAQRKLAAQLLAHRVESVTLLPVGVNCSAIRAALEKIVPREGDVLLVGGPELSADFVALCRDAQRILGVQAISEASGEFVFTSPALGGKVNVLHRSRFPLRRLTMVTLKADAAFIGEAVGRAPLQTTGGQASRGGGGRVVRVSLDLGSSKPDEIERLLAEAGKEVKANSIKDAEFLIDVGYAIRTKEQLEQIVTPLKKTLEELGVKNVMIGGTRKVVEELKLLGHDQQIGQTGTPVNPRVMLCLGVSGAPQHVDYIGERAVIFAFNKDAEAPLMTLNQRRKAPKVYPIVGDLYETVPRFVAALRQQKG